MFRKKRGFTLIELLIVIAVIGILAAAIMPRFISFDYDAKSSSTLGSLSSLRAAVILYRAKEDAYSSSLSGVLGSYIDAMPVAQWHVSSTATVVDSSAGTAGATMIGGWWYNSSTGEVRINSTHTSSIENKALWEY